MKFSYENSALVDNNELQTFGERLTEYQNILTQAKRDSGYKTLEASLFLPFDKDILNECKKIKEEKCTASLKYIVVIGIGGSNLGTKAIYDTKFGHFDKYQPNRSPRMLFASTNDSSELQEIRMLLDNDVHDISEVFINIVTKSGTTTETIANAEVIIGSLKNKFGEAIHRRVVVTTNEGSPLWEVAREHNLSTLSIPEMVGGRFSVFSPVGILPLMCAGFDVEAFRRGAQDVLEKSSVELNNQNPSFVSASILYKHYQNGKNIHDTFLFHPECESLGKWYRQLLGESVGKEKNIRGEVVNIGITPTVSIGSTDLHSVGQLYLGGPNNRVTTFVSAKDVRIKVGIPETRLFPNIVPNISGKTLDDISNAILKGVKDTYRNRQMPFMDIELSNLSMESLGAFMQSKMLEIMYLGTLFEVNVFDQPSVESYKEEIRKNLT